MHIDVAVKGMDCGSQLLAPDHELVPTRFRVDVTVAICYNQKGCVQKHPNSRLRKGLKTEFDAQKLRSIDLVGV
eukprot:1035314-Amphidinium_carterae.1